MQTVKTPWQVFIWPCSSSFIVSYSTICVTFNGNELLSNFWHIMYLQSTMKCYENYVRNFIVITNNGKMQITDFRENGAMNHYSFNRYQIPQLLGSVNHKIWKDQRLNKEDLTEKWYKNSKPWHSEVKVNIASWNRILEEKIN